MALFKSFTPTPLTIAGIGIVNMIREGQFRPELRRFQQFCQVAASYRTLTARGVDFHPEVTQAGP